MHESHGDPLRSRTENGLTKIEFLALEQVYDAFDREWASGQSPDLAATLSRVAPAMYAAAFRELLAIDVEWRRRNRLPIDAALYVQQFPEQRAVIEAVCSEADGAATGLSPWPTLPGYEILDEVGRGGMGVVYRAFHSAAHRVVAVKVIRESAFSDRDESRRFLIEARLTARLDHRHIVPIYDVGTFQGQPYYAMKLIQGPSLRDLLLSGPLPARRAAEIIATVADAVAYSHSHGVIHRDLKPGNLLLERGVDPFITDFGLAKLASSSHDLTRTGYRLGTPSYLPPEQARGEPTGPAADIYALGAVLYELLTGRPPFRAETPLATLAQVLETEVVSPRLLNPTIPRDLETICLRCLQKDPARRYVSASALRHDLLAFLNGRPIAARPVSWVERTWRWTRSNKAAASGIVASSVAMLALMCIAIISTMWSASEARRRAAEQLVQSSRFFSLLSQARDAEGRRNVGWTQRVSADLTEARPLQADASQDVVMRSLAFAAASAFDIRLSRVISPPGDLPELFGVAVDPQGRRCAIGLHFGEPLVRVWIYDLVTGEMVDERIADGRIAMLWKTALGDPRYNEGVASLAWSADGRWLLAGTRQGRVLRWDLTEKTHRYPLNDHWWHDRRVDQLACSADGQFVASEDADTVLGGTFGSLLQKPVWRVETQGWARIVSGSDGVVLLTSNGLFDLDWQRGKTRAVISPQRAYGVNLSPDGAVVATNYTGVLRLYDVQTGRAWPELRDESVAATILDRPFFSADQRYVLALADDRRLRVWDRVSSSLVLVSPVLPGSRRIEMQLTPDCRRAVFRLDHTVQIYDLESGAAQSIVGLQHAEVEDFDVHPVDGRVVTLSTAVDHPHPNALDQCLATWDPQIGQRLTDQHVVNSLGAICSGDRAPTPCVKWVGDGGECQVVPFRGVPFALNVNDPRTWTPLTDGRSLGTVIEQDRWRPNTSMLPVEVVDDPLAIDGRAVRLSSAGDRATDIAMILAPHDWPTDAELCLALFRVRISRNRQHGPAVQLSWLEGDRHIQRDYPLSSTAFPDDGYHWVYGDVFHRENAAGPHPSHLIVTRPTDALGDVWVDQLRLIPIRSISGPHWAVWHLGPFRRNADRGSVGVLNEDRIVSWSPQGQLGPVLYDNSDMTFKIGSSTLSQFDLTERQWVAAGRDGSILCLQPGTTSPLIARRIFPDPLEPVTALALSPDSKWVWVGDSTGRIRQIDVNTGQQQWSVAAHGESVSAVVVMEQPPFAEPAAFHLATAAADGSITLWNVSSGGLSPTLTLHESRRPIRRLAVSPGSRRVSVLYQREYGVRQFHLDGITP
jgi:serine/threonine protein kinase/WD40 repeat protein